MKIVGVRFRGSLHKVYNFLHTEELPAGTMVVVESALAGGILVVVEVVDQNTASEPEKVTKWIVDVVDMAGHNKRKEDTIQRRKLMAELKIQAQAQSELAIYEKMAENNPAMRETLEKLKALG
jgi:hypothetical protein